MHVHTSHAHTRFYIRGWEKGSGFSYTHGTQVVFGLERKERNNEIRPSKTRTGDMYRKSVNKIRKQRETTDQKLAKEDMERRYGKRQRRKRILDLVYKCTIQVHNVETHLIQNVNTHTGTRFQTRMHMAVQFSERNQTRNKKIQYSCGDFKGGK